MSEAISTIRPSSVVDRRSLFLYVAVHFLLIVSYAGLRLDAFDWRAGVSIVGAASSRDDSMIALVQLIFVAESDI